MKKVLLLAISLISLFPAQAYGENVQSLRARHSSTVTGSHGASATTRTSRRPIADESTAYVAQPYGYPYSSPGYQTPIQGFGYPYSSPGYNNFGYNNFGYNNFTSGYPSNFNNFGVYANPLMGYGYGNMGYGMNPMLAHNPMPPVSMGPAGYNNGSSVWNSPLILNHRFSSPGMGGSVWGNPGFGMGAGYGYDDYSLMGGYGAGYGYDDYSLLGGYGGYGYGYGYGYGDYSLMGGYGGGYDSCFDDSCGGGGFAMGIGGAGWGFGLDIGW